MNDGASRWRGSFVLSDLLQPTNEKISIPNRQPLAIVFYWIYGENRVHLYCNSGGFVVQLEKDN